MTKGRTPGVRRIHGSRAPFRYSSRRGSVELRLRALEPFGVELLDRVGGTRNERSASSSGVKFERT